MLGTACNWKCRYCLQIKEAGFNQKLEDSFCENLQDFIIKNNLKIDRIDFWGGEPCLFFKQIKKIKEIPSLKDIPSRFVTNGSLLTKEIIDFLNNYNFLVNLSYHEGQLDEHGWEQAMFIHNLRVTSLVHAKCLNWDIYYQKWKELYQNYGRCLNWYVYNLYNVPNISEYCLTTQHIDIYIKYLLSIFPLTKISIFYKNALETLINTEFSKQKNYQCACFNEDVLSIDTLGNQYICHHACSKDFKVGNIFTDGISKFKLNTLKDKCKTCYLLPYCNGGCMREINDTSCYFLHRLFDVKLKYEDFLNEI